MGKKITRRVVLGTAIGAIAAAPFIVRGLRSRDALIQQGYSHLLSETRIQFFDDWKDVCKLLSVEQTPIAHPATLTLKYDFTKPRVLKFCSLETTFIGDFDSPETCGPENLMCYNLMEGTINVEGGEHGKLDVNVLKNVRKHVEIDFEASRKNGAEIVESQTTTSDGSVVQNVTITPSLKYDAATKSTKMNVVEKVVVSQLPVCQFFFTPVLNIDRASVENLRALPDNYEFLKLLWDFHNLIRFPLPEHAVEIGQEYEYPMIHENAFILEIPSYKARLQGMVMCGGFNAVSIVPVCTATFDEFREHMRKHYDALLGQSAQAGNRTEQQRSEGKQWYDQRVEKVGEKNKGGIPDLTYLIDTEMGCVLRREEYNPNYIDKVVGNVSAVQKIFQLV